MAYRIGPFIACGRPLREMEPDTLAHYSAEWTFDMDLSPDRAPSRKNPVRDERRPLDSLNTERRR